jgi:plasmid stabilization system protein ParE
MKLDVIFSEFAKREFDDAIKYYELEAEGLGDRFQEEIKKAIFRIIAYPKSWSTERGDIRKYLMHRFPYKILYSVEHNHIFIVAIAHQHRLPHYWVDNG